MNMKPGLVDPLQKTITLGDIAPKWTKRNCHFHYPLDGSSGILNLIFREDVLLEKHMVLVHRTKKSARSAIDWDGNLDTHF